MVGKKLIEACATTDFNVAHKHLQFLWFSGYSAVDIVGTLFRVAKNQQMDEYKKLEFLRVCNWFRGLVSSVAKLRQEIGLAHMRILSGVSSFLQLSALVAKLCSVKPPPV
jgi:replication factor C subunit 2/4